MSTDADQENRRDTDITDELPILIETVVLEPGEGPKTADARDDTGEHTGNFSTLVRHEAESVEALKHDLERKAAKIAELEGDIARQSKRWPDVERVLLEKDAQIGDLSNALASARTELVERSASEERLTAEIIDRDNQFAGLLGQLELLRAEVADARAEVERQQREREIERDEIAKARADLHRQVIAAATPSEQELREELDALKSYVTNRSVWWAELEARAAGHALRIAELEREVAHRAARQQQTEALAARETARAEGLRDELVSEARRTETLEAELRKVHAERAATASAGVDHAAAELDAAREALATAQRERDRAIEEVAALRERDRRQTEEIALATRQRAAAEHAARASAELLAASAGGGAGASVSTAEVAAQLEAELEQKRTELTSERAASRAKQESLAAATAGLEATRGQLAEARGQLEQARADAARLERTLIDKDRALEARDERIRTLQAELDLKRAGAQKFNALDVSLQALDSKTSERLRRTDSPAEPPNTPTLICLTSDSPRQYPLAKRTMTIGRSSRCDIQILTHFVSREHARLTVSAESNVVIEDLGSTNGVFVNSVRIERQELHHGDLVTVGETQFRFLETMAH
jgi:chromosome segregation ATPase